MEKAAIALRPAKCHTAPAFSTFKTKPPFSSARMAYKADKADLGNIFSMVKAKGRAHDAFPARQGGALPRIWGRRGARCFCGLDLGQKWYNAS
jgi:hypothetical protein